jgi:hypothetical protein
MLWVEHANTGHGSPVCRGAESKKNRRIPLGIPQRHDARIRVGITSMPRSTDISLEVAD